MKLEHVITAAVLSLSTVVPAAGGTAIDIEEAQGTLAIEGIDAWLFYGDSSSNPIASELVAPDPEPQHPWFFLVPMRGRPVALCHQVDAASFDGGHLIRPYGTTAQRNEQLLAMVRGLSTVAMEHDPSSPIASLNRVPETVVRSIEKAGTQVVSSARLVQFTKSLWRRDGRVHHYVAAHHLHRIHLEAIEFIENELRVTGTVTELDVQKKIAERYVVRGIVGEPAIVAAGEHSADPAYLVSAQGNRKIGKGDVVRLSMSGRVEGASRAIAANLTWTLYIGDDVPKDVAQAFSAVASARDAVIDLVRTRYSRRSPVLGYEADEKARSVISEAGLAAHIAHPTGHSLDTSVLGAGANLDSSRGQRDSRPLVSGAGFSVGPGVYVPGRFGVHTEVNVFLGTDGVEVTSPIQGEVRLVRGP